MCTLCSPRLLWLYLCALCVYQHSSVCPTTAVTLSMCTLCSPQLSLYLCALCVHHGCCGYIYVYSVCTSTTISISIFTLCAPPLLTLRSICVPSQLLLYVSVLFVYRQSYHYVFMYLTTVIATAMCTLCVSPKLSLCLYVSHHSYCYSDV